MQTVLMVARSKWALPPSLFPTSCGHHSAPACCRPLFVWNAYIRAEFANNIVAIQSDRSVLWTGTTCMQKHETDGNGLCTNNYADNFAEANFHGNVYWNSSGVLSDSFPSGHGEGSPRNLNVSFKDWQHLGHDKDSVVADPMFVDSAHSDYRLKVGSPALARGFEPLRLESAGPDWEPPRRGV